MRDIPVFAFPGFRIDEDGVVYGKRDRPLVHFYTHRGYRSIVLTGKRASKIQVRIDRLMALTFSNIPLNEDISVHYRDDDFNNVKLSNLVFIRK